MLCDPLGRIIVLGAQLTLAMIFRAKEPAGPPTR